MVNKCLETHDFLECVWATDGTHIEIKEPNEHDSDYIDRKRYYSINVQVVCDYSYCFLDVVVKWLVSVHDSRIFLNSLINKKLRNEEIPKFEKKRDSVTTRHGTRLFSWRPCLPSITFFNERIFRGIKKPKRKIFRLQIIKCQNYNWEWIWQVESSV